MAGRTGCRSIRYTVNTQVVAPHGAHRIVALSFHPHLPMAVTVGQDQRFKVWQQGEPETRKGVAGTAPHAADAQARMVGTAAAADE